MRRASGRAVSLNGRSIYVEESGQGGDWVVFEAGAGLGRTSWDAVLPLLADRARLVAYDRAGFGRSGRTPDRPSVDEMAADLLALIDEVVAPSAPVILVAHSMGGLVARRAADGLGPRLRGLLLLDPTPERAPVYDRFDETAQKVDRVLAVTQQLVRLRPFARIASGRARRVFPPDTYTTMLTEDYVPAGIAQTRKELRAVVAAIPQFRATPPDPPTCPTVLLSPTRPDKGRSAQRAAMTTHQRQWTTTLPNGTFEEVDSGHLVQGERPETVAEAISRLLDRTA